MLSLMLLLALVVCSVAADCRESCKGAPSSCERPCLECVVKCEREYRATLDVDNCLDGCFLAAREQRTAEGITALERGKALRQARVALIETADANKSFEEHKELRASLRALCGDATYRCYESYVEPDLQAQLAKYHEDEAKRTALVEEMAALCGLRFPNQRDAAARRECLSDFESRPARERARTNLREARLALIEAADANKSFEEHKELRAGVRTACGDATYRCYGSYVEADLQAQLAKYHEDESKRKVLVEEMAALCALRFPNRRDAAARRECLSDFESRPVIKARREAQVALIEATDANKSFEERAQLRADLKKLCGDDVSSCLRFVEADLRDLWAKHKNDASWPADQRRLVSDELKAICAKKPSEERRRQCMADLE